MSSQGRVAFLARDGDNSLSVAGDLFGHLQQAAQPQPPGAAPSLVAVLQPDKQLLMQNGVAEVHRLIGAGAYAKVFECSVPGYGERVAVKLLGNTDPSQARALEATKELEHPHLLRLLNVLAMDPFCLVYPLCAGGTLRELLRERVEGAPGIDQRLGAMLQVFSAAEYLHTNAVIHRDVKPSNIFLNDVFQDAMPSVVLGDLGFARRLGGAGQMMTTCGTPRYMAPELLREEPYDASVDIYASGVSLYEVCTGDLPEPGRNHARGSEMQFAMRVMSGWRPSLEALKQVPMGDALATIIEQCWAQDSNGRISASDLVLRVAALL